jgi:hypothetical protein
MKEGNRIQSGQGLGWGTPTGEEPWLGELLIVLVNVAFRLKKS